MPYSPRWRRLRLREIEAGASDGMYPEPTLLTKLSEDAVHLLLVAQPVVVTATAAGKRYRAIAGQRSLGIARACLAPDAEIRAVLVDSDKRGVAQALRAVDQCVAPTLLSLPPEERVRRWARAVDDPERLEGLGFRLTHNEAARCAGVSRSRYFRLRAASQDDGNG